MNLFKNLFKKNMEVDKLPREELINNFIEGFLYDFHYLLTKKNLDVPELPDDALPISSMSISTRRPLQRQNLLQILISGYVGVIGMIILTSGLLQIVEKVM